MISYTDMLTMWRDDEEKARDLIYLSPATVQLPYNSQALLLERLRFQFFTLTAMQNGELSDASL